ncbi:hypothetical protein MFMK1_001155 [Metallumcola ferriviriculae]|uniref:GTPase-associated system helical domain-containing protein n=1 Tax=Metallumcola ferriviriculae TaxID=3039180 RepID=A0AAU0ULU4_9FIRM|nr:hypothetical protein MFMK1_001155 [Desulfitibacteraceae bacterium MK1]
MKTLAFNERKYPVPEIFDEVQKRFDIKTAKIRENLSPVKINTSISRKILKSLKGAKDTEEWNSQVMAEEFYDYISNLNKWKTEINLKIIKNERQQKIYLEDSQILWWMTGEWSRDLKKPFNQMQVTESSIVIGKELADLVNILPGPYASEAVINKTLSSLGDSNARCTMAEIIDKQSNDWKQILAENYPSEKTKEITPLLLAIDKSNEVEGAKEWLPAFKKLTGFNADEIELSAFSFAYQIYLECLVVKCLKDDEGAA